MWGGGNVGVEVPSGVGGGEFGGGESWGGGRVGGGELGRHCGISKDKTKKLI